MAYTEAQKRASIKYILKTLSASLTVIRITPYLVF